MEDYYKDGLLMCGKCHTKKQTRIVFFGQPRTVDCLCKCQTEERDRKKKEAEDARQQELLSARRAYAFAGGKYPGESASRSLPRMAEWNFALHDGSNPAVKAKAEAYVKNFRHFADKGRGLIFYGPTGTGKTFLACCIVNAVLEAGWSAIVTNFSTIANDLLGTWDKAEYMERLMSCKLLVLDDLDVERNTGYMNETVYNVIDSRYRSGKPMLITTNLTAEQLKSPDTIEKQRIYSRIMDVCIPIVFSGDDRRYKNAKAEYAEDLKILNGGL